MDDYENIRSKLQGKATLVISMLYQKELYEP